MTSIIFYDTETTDKLINFAQIIQCGSILTNELFTPLDQQDVSCGPLPVSYTHLTLPTTPYV